MMLQVVANGRVKLRRVGSQGNVWLGSCNCAVSQRFEVSIDHVLGGRIVVRLPGTGNGRQDIFAHIILVLSGIMSITKGLEIALSEA